jgi:hypothetical protein
MVRMLAVRRRARSSNLLLLGQLLGNLRRLAKPEIDLK